jgi:hypothetical protein
MGRLETGQRAMGRVGGAWGPAGRAGGAGESAGLGRPTAPTAPAAQVLQLPIVKHRLKKLLSQAVKKIALLGAPVIPSSDDTLEQFLQAAGKFFGKDPAKWEQVGEQAPCSGTRGTRP